MEPEQQNQASDNSNNNPKKSPIGIVIAVIVLLLIGATIFWMQKNKVKNTETTNNNPQTQNPNNSSLDNAPIKTENSQSTTDISSSTYVTGNTITINDTNSKKITVVGSSFKFAPNEIRVKKGDNVTIVFQNSGGTHNFVIDEFNVKTKTISGGDSDTVTFTASKTGTFEYYCSVGEHRQMGMKGNLIVE